MYALNHTKNRAFPPYQQRIFHTRKKKEKKKRASFLFSRSNRKIEQSSTDPIPSRLKRLTEINQMICRYLVANQTQTYRKEQQKSSKRCKKSKIYDKPLESKENPKKYLSHEGSRPHRASNRTGETIPAPSISFAFASPDLNLSILLAFASNPSSSSPASWILFRLFLFASKRKRSRI